MKKLPLILFFLVSFNLQAQNSFLFPKDCLGRYSGTMYIEYIGKGIVDSAHVELEFSKTDKDFEWNYFNTIKYKIPNNIIANNIFRILKFFDNFF